MIVIEAKLHNLPLRDDMLKIAQNSTTLIHNNEKKNEVREVHFLQLVVCKHRGDALLHKISSRRRVIAQAVEIVLIDPYKECGMVGKKPGTQISATFVCLSEC